MQLAVVPWGLHNSIHAGMKLSVSRYARDVMGFKEAWPTCVCSVTSADWDMFK